MKAFDSILYFNTKDMKYTSCKFKNYTYSLIRSCPICLQHRTYTKTAS